MFGEMRSRVRVIADSTLCLATLNWLELLEEVCRYQIKLFYCIVSLGGVVVSPGW